MTILQEMKMCKWKAIFKFFYKWSYHKDIMKLCNILSKGRLTSKRATLTLRQIHFSHEINYPEWVIKLCEDLAKDKNNYKIIKVFEHKGKFIVIDGNHRLKALKIVLKPYNRINVLLLKYEK